MWRALAREGWLGALVCVCVLLYSMILEYNNDLGITNDRPTDRVTLKCYTAYNDTIHTLAARQWK